MSKIIKVESCAGCGYKNKDSSTDIVFCEHPETSAMFNVYEFVESETLPENCPLDDEVQKWISVKDKLPRECIDVLVYSKRGIWVDSYGSNGEIREMDFCEHWVWGYKKEVTHWMPEPDKPIKADLKDKEAGG